MKDIASNSEQSTRYTILRYKRNASKYYKQAAEIGIFETNDS